MSLQKSGIGSATVSFVVLFVVVVFVVFVCVVVVVCSAGGIGSSSAASLVGSVFNGVFSEVVGSSVFVPALEFCIESLVDSGESCETVMSDLNHP